MYKFEALKDIVITRKKYEHYMVVSVADENKPKETEYLIADNLIDDKPVRRNGDNLIKGIYALASNIESASPEYVRPFRWEYNSAWERSPRNISHNIPDDLSSPVPNKIKRLIIQWHMQNGNLIPLSDRIKIPDNNRVVYDMEGHVVGHYLEYEAVRIYEIIYHLMWFLDSYEFCSGLIHDWTNDVYDNERMKLEVFTKIKQMPISYKIWILASITAGTGIFGGLRIYFNANHFVDGNVLSQYSLATASYIVAAFVHLNSAIMLHRLCANEKCGSWFIPDRDNQAYCNKCKADKTTIKTIQQRKFRDNQAQVPYKMEHQKLYERYTQYHRRLGTPQDVMKEGRAGMVKESKARIKKIGQAPEGKKQQLIDEYIEWARGYDHRSVSGKKV